AFLLHQLLVILQRIAEAGDKQFLGVGSGDLEREIPERSHLGYEPKQETEQPRAKAGLFVLTGPLFFISGSRNAIEKCGARNSRRAALNFVFLGLPGDLRRFRYHLADASAVGT